MDNKQAMLTYISENLPRYQKDLMELVRIPSVSTDPSHQADILKAANWLKAYLLNLGYHANIYPTQKHPIVIAESIDGPIEQVCPTVLIYGHYDVQPSDPDDQWKTPPFEPMIIGHEMFARGASDMKGQFIATAAAAEAFREFFPGRIKIKFILEGEEEIGSPNLIKFLEEHADLLKADVALNPDAGMIAKDIPTITLGLRGIINFELMVTGPDHDLHSGSYGGVIDNPIHVLSSIIGKMHDENGKINIPGFYDDVEEISISERESINKCPTNEKVILDQTSAPMVWGESGYTIPERIGIRPSLNVNGIFGGYTGEGSKTIIPSTATAKLSFRLVKNQQPDKVNTQLRAFLEKNMPGTIKWDLKVFSGAKAARTNPDHPANQALIYALTDIWGIAPLYKMEGGSIPVVNDMEKILGVGSILTGFGLADDRIHSPNEKLDLECWAMGIQALALFFYHYCDQN
jgi:acetylornithine deacetylase/succinyl-diaminopimelate desuccinylase-like protein